MITGEIRKFTMQLLGYAQEYQCSPLLHYAQSLATKLQQFGIDGISQLIQDFPQFKQSLKLLRD